MQDKADDLGASPTNFSHCSSLPSEDSDSEEEDIDQLIFNSRQVLRESVQASNTDLKVPYK